MRVVWGTEHTVSNAEQQDYYEASDIQHNSKEWGKPILGCIQQSNLWITIFTILAYIFPWSYKYFLLFTFDVSLHFLPVGDRGMSIICVPCTPQIHVSMFLLLYYNLKWSLKCWYLFLILCHVFPSNSSPLYPCNAPSNCGRCGDAPAWYNNLR